MSKTYVQPGQIIDVTLGGTVLSGGVGVVGQFVGIYTKGGVSGDVVGLEIDGVHSVVKLAGEAWTTGVKVYWDPIASKFTTTSTSNNFAGYAADAAISAAVIGKVLLARPGS